MQDEESNTNYVRYQLPYPYSLKEIIKVETCKLVVLLFVIVMSVYFIVRASAFGCIYNCKSL